MKLWCVVIAAILLGCRAAEPPQAEAPKQVEDYSFEAVSERFAEERRQSETKVRSQYRSEVQRCEKELKGTWLSPGSCCVPTADGCEPQKL